MKVRRLVMYAVLTAPLIALCGSGAGAAGATTPGPCDGGPTPPASTEVSAVGPAGVRWTQVLGATSLGGGSTPLVAGGLVYVAANAQVLALRDSDGSPVWSVPTADYSHALLVTDGNLVVETFRSLTAYDLATGTVRWTRATSGNILGSPVRTSGDGLAFGLGDGHTEVVDLASGAVRWSRRGVGQDAVVADSRTVIRLDSDYLRAFDATTGKQLWLRRGSINGAVLTGGVLAITDATGGLARGLDPRSGKTRWTGGRWGQAALGVDGGVLYTSGRQLVLAKVTSGKVRWRTAGHVDPGTVQTSTDAGVFADVEATGHGGAQQLGRRLRDGHVVWAHPGEVLDQSQGGGAAETGPVFLTSLLDGAGGGDVTSLSTSTGAIAWRVHLTQEPYFAAEPDSAGAIVLTATTVVACPA